MGLLSARPRAVLLSALLSTLLLFITHDEGRAGQPVRRRAVSALTRAGLGELSGLAASLRSPGVLWAHNDSGNAAELIAINGRGAPLLRVTLPVELDDPEDIASARCPLLPRFQGAESCLWLADVGDNKHRRSLRSIWIFAEPPLPASSRRVALSRASLFELRLRFPDEARANAHPGLTLAASRRPNIEALAVSPSGERLWLFEKSDAPTARLWEGHLTARALSAHELSLEALSPLSAARLGQDTSAPRGARITGAAMSGAGDRLLLRTYHATFLFALPTPGALRQLARLPARLLPGVGAGEPQGEAISFDMSGSFAWTASELRDGAQPAPQRWRLPAQGEPSLRLAIERAPRQRLGGAPQGS